MLSRALTSAPAAISASAMSIWFKRVAISSGVRRAGSRCSSSASAASSACTPARSPCSTACSMGLSSPANDRPRMALRKTTATAITRQPLWQDITSKRPQTKKGARGPLPVKSKSGPVLRGLGLAVGFLGLEASPVGGTLGRDVAVDELDHGHRGVVAVTEAGLHDAQIAAVAGGIARRDGVEQTLGKHVRTDCRDNLTTGVQVAALAEGDELLHDRAKLLG